jgi:lipopolysaccharide transport system permease protein
MSVQPDELVIEAGQSARHYWGDLWRYRELLGFLAWRDVKVRYKQTVLGAAWALLQPGITLVVFTFVFGRLAQMPSGQVPYPLLVMAGLLPWQLFANALSSASSSLVSNTHLISKVYFPRLVVPLSALAVALIDFAIVGVLYAGLCV